MTESSFSSDHRMALSVWDLARRLSPHPMPKAKENYSTTLCLHNLESITLINRLLWGHPQSNPSSGRLQRSKKVLIYQQKWPFCFGFSFSLSLLSAASLWFVWKRLVKAPRAQFAIFEVWVRSTVKVLISEGWPLSCPVSYTIATKWREKAGKFWWEIWRF